MTEDEFLNMFQRLVENGRISIDTNEEYYYGGVTKVSEIEILFDNKAVKTIKI